MPAPVQGMPTAEGVIDLAPSEQDRPWAMLCHLLAMLVAGFLSPLIVMLTRGEQPGGGFL